MPVSRKATPRGNGLEDSGAVLVALQRLLDRVELSLDSVNPVQEFLFVLLGMSHALLPLGFMILSGSIFSQGVSGWG